MITLPNRIELIKTLPRGAVMAEIGVRRGDFSEEILTRTPVKKLYLIDPWQKYEGYPDSTQPEHDGNCRETLWKARKYPGMAEVIRGHSTTEALTWSREPLDAVYLDGHHGFEAVMCDLFAWSKNLSPTGCIMGHDYIPPTHPAAVKFNIGVMAAVNLFCQMMPWEMTFITSEEFASFRLDRK